VSNDACNQLAFLFGGHDGLPLVVFRYLMT
jgi:hypothetical protein